MMDPLTGAESSRPARDLRIAWLNLQASRDPALNAECISQALEQAASLGVDALLTPECALCGYPGAHRPDLSTCDPDHLADLATQLIDQASTHGLCLVLGTAGRHPNQPQQWSNQAWIGGGSGDADYGGGADREGLRTIYHKKHLTGIDQQHFLPGMAGAANSGMITIAGWRCGISICFDLRFPHVFQEQLAAGADALITIAHMAGPDPDPGTKAVVIPALCAARATETVSPLVLCNALAEDRWLSSGHWDCAGIQQQAEYHGQLGLCQLQHRQQRHRWYDYCYQQARQANNTMNPELL